MRILGIDPGYGILGWSVIESDLTLIDYGIIETSAKLRFDDRLLQIHLGLKKIITDYSPQCVSIEKLFFQRNSTTALDVSKAIGAVVLTVRLFNLDYYEYTPLQVKQAVTGYGRASKEQMQGMVKTIFKLKEVPQPDDAADALAVAACHSFNFSATHKIC